VLIFKESRFTILSQWSTGNLPDIFKDLPGLINKIQGLFWTAKKNQDFSRMWQPSNNAIKPGCGNFLNSVFNIVMKFCFTLSTFNPQAWKNKDGAILWTNPHPLRSIRLMFWFFFSFNLLNVWNYPAQILSYVIVRLTKDSGESWSRTMRSRSSKRTFNIW